MKLLLDTHLLLWAAGHPDRLSADARALIEAEENELFFSAASLWEIVIKCGLGRENFKVDARLLRRGLLDNGRRGSGQSITSGGKVKDESCCSLTSAATSPK